MSADILTNEEIKIILFYRDLKPDIQMAVYMELTNLAFACTRLIEKPKEESEAKIVKFRQKYKR